MTPDETARLLARLAQSEDPWVERKQSFKEQEVRKTVVGFANSLAEGQTAVVFIGADNKGRHRGEPDADDTQKKVNGILQRCYPPIPYQTCVLTVQVEGQPREILAILVPYSTNRPHFAGAAYVRRGSETLEASAEMFRELIASQNDKARRILQFKDRKVCLRLRSNSGFWYDLECTLRSCDAHSVTVCDSEGRLWSFPIPDVGIHGSPMHDLVVTASPDCTEEEHIRTMVRRWARWRKPPASGDFSLNPDPILNQLLANPVLAMPAVAAEADSSPDPWLKLLLVHVRFALKKVQNPMTREQKIARLREQHQAILGDFARRGFPQVWGPGFLLEVRAAIEVATSIDEAKEFLERVIQKNKPDVQTQQRRWLVQELGLPDAQEM